MEIHGWGRYPKVEADVVSPLTASACVNLVNVEKTLIARGLGRSYGDSSLASSVLDTRYLRHFFDFDENTGLLTCTAGMTLDEILRIFVPRGWFLPVTPGTRFITVGGAIASDVHGKNHHIAGTFTDYVSTIELLLGNGERVFASATEESELFHATCGGMGLTGVILSASLQLRAIYASSIIETTIKAADLDELLSAFSDHASATYSVAWVDCLARGKNLGRSLLSLGEHANKGGLTVQAQHSCSVPFDMPGNLLNQFSIQAFNSLHYSAVRSTCHTRHIPFERFFYPLDKLSNWNRLYGRRGFIQYQLALPKAGGVGGLREVMEYIANSGRGSFLAVLKVFGKANNHHLSFPFEGYTLALDFKAEPTVFQLLDNLDQIVLKYGGRLYLCKDARMSEFTFKASYPRWQEFEEVRERYHAIGKFASHQSQRLGLQ